MNNPVYEIRLDHQLLEELYGVQPQAITWMTPIWNNDGDKIIDFEFVYSNKEGLRYLNLTAAEFHQLRLSNSPTLTDEFRKVVLEEMIGVYTTGRIAKTDVFNAALNKYARVLRTKLRDGVLTVVQDRTEENRIIHQLEKQTKELEEKSLQLEEQKSLLDSILANSSNGISVSKIFRDEGRRVVDAQTIMANDAAVKFIGLPREIYLTKRATEIEPAVIGSPYYQACIRTLETGEPFMMQYYMQSTNRWLELTVSKLDYHHLIQVFTDITPMKEAQLQLEKAATRLRTVVNAANTGMFTFQPEYNNSGDIVDFRFTMVNSTISRFAGKAPEELEGQLGVNWFPGYLTNGEFDLYKHCFETGEPQRTEIRYYQNGQDYYLDLQCVKIDDQLLVTLTDYSILRKSQVELEQTVKALERSNAYLEDFAHAASHDMKEPLRKIQTFTDRLRERLLPHLDETELKLFERIENASERMTLLVEDLLEFSHVSKQAVEVSAVDLGEKVQRVLADLELVIEEKATIHIGELPVVKGNRRQLQQLFQNLIGNALKYSKPEVPPVIHLSWEKVAGDKTGFPLSAEETQKLFHLFRIKDNGIGFEQQYAERIFNIFTRLHGRAEYAGTGVGLAIVKKVVENHHGYIKADGEAGNGATFTVLLPVT